MYFPSYDWFGYYSLEEINQQFPELEHKFTGPGWYSHGDDWMLVILQQPTSDPDKFQFYVFNGSNDPRVDMRAIADMKVIYSSHGKD